MEKLPELNDIVVEIFNSEESSTYDKCDYYTVESIVPINGQNVYILDGGCSCYKAKTAEDFMCQEIYDEIIDPSFFVVNIENKNIELKKHKENYSKISFNVLKNEYEICLSEKSSLKVKDDMVLELNQFINKDNYKRFINNRKTDYIYQVKWDKNRYKWELEW